MTIIPISAFWTFGSRCSPPFTVVITFTFLGRFSSRFRSVVLGICAHSATCASVMSGANVRRGGPARIFNSPQRCPVGLKIRARGLPHKPCQGFVHKDVFVPFTSSQLTVQCYSIHRVHVTHLCASGFGRGSRYGGEGQVSANFWPYV